jgi:hypothetical protein
MRYVINLSAAMVTRKPRPASSITAAELARLNRAVRRCSSTVERLRRDTEAALKRIQTDIDNLRSKLRN